tara:strand:- start:3267 stop:3995 length:729 start_codon:yes stop_codon:yes gene_type:complete
MINSPDQLNLNIKLDDSVSLEKFIHCESNKEALNFLKKSLEKDSVSNLFYIWGEEGVGKSYIMQALNKELIGLNKKTLHLSLDDSRITSPEILKNLDSLEAILIEKLDKLEKTNDWETQLFNLVNEALNSETKIYLSSNIVSKDLEIELKDLKSRLSYFTAIEIPEITQDEKIDALRQSSARRGIELDEKTIDFILNHTSRSLSDLLRLINEIDLYSLKKKRKVTPYLIRELLKVKSDKNHI